MRHLLLIVVLLLHHTVFGQITVPDSILIKKFSSLYILKSNINQYILVGLNENTPVDLKNKILVNAARKLSENVFIIEKQKLSIISPGKRPFDEYDLSNDHWKLSPLLDEIRISKARNKDQFRFTIAYKNAEFPGKFLQQNPHLKKNISAMPSLHLLSIYCTYQDIKSLFLHNDEVLFIDVNIVPPKEELASGGFDLSANKINMVHSRYSLINGSGQHVSIKENYYDTADIDLKGRLEFSPLASSIVTNHANFMATIIGGAGNSVYHAKGVAWGTGISSSSFEQILPDPTAYYTQYNITVQNHSYGTAIDNTYGLNAAAFDNSSNENPELLHVFSSGNSGNTASTSGSYAGITGYANLTGNFKMAKNSIVAGAADSFGVVSPLSSKGPAYDGRIKPELTAFEKSGTSEAAAVVSGTALLLQQYYKNNNGILLPSALAKAILINSADDVNNTGPDYASGFGNLNAFKAMQILKDNTLLSGTVNQNDVQAYSINVPPNISELKITLVWNDPDATPFNPKALVNDLDLTLIATANNDVWRPWVLSSFPHSDSLAKIPQRKRDSLNNVEQVSLQSPVAGNYQIKIHGYNLPMPSQNFNVAYSMDTLNHFTWQYPSDIDFLETGRENILRWETTFPGAGDIEYSIVPSTAWSSVSANTDLAKKYFKWTPPDTTVQCLVRMKIGNNYFYSDTFLIAALPVPKVGFVCSDTVLLYWNRIKGISQFQVYQLGNRYMDPFVKVADTVVLLLRNSLTAKHFSVGTVLPNGINGPKSYALDYTLQGTSCFLKTFFADANGDKATLTLSLGTTYKISNITFQKFSAGEYYTIDSFPPAAQTTFVYNYQPLTPGISLFRAKITLQSGEIIFSNVSSVFFVEPGKYILLPVPVRRNNDVEILSTIPGAELFQLFDVMGRQVLQREIHSAHERIKTSSLQPGQYFYRITKQGVKLSSGKLLIL